MLTGSWRYAGAAVTNILPQVTRAGNDGSIAVLGSVFSTATSSETGGNYNAVGIVNGVTVTYHDGTTGIDQFFTDLASGAVNPAIIVTAGTGSGNDLSGADGAALTNNATSIANFVNSGGGLIGHGSGSTAFGWLTALLSGINFPGGCSSSTLTLTAAGIAAFPGLTNSDIQSGPCHGNFTGDLGPLQVLADDGQQRNIIIGGANVKLPGNIDLTPSAATNSVGTTHTVTATALDGTPPVPAVGVTVTFAVTSGPNVGVSGTCSSNADCTTDANGQVSFTYTGDGGVGTDTISASFVTTREVTESTLVQKTWELPIATPTATPTPAPTVLAATATPTPVPTVLAATATPTPAALPVTGGALSDGGSDLPWLAAIVGAIALIGSGGALFAYQRRRIR